MVVKDFDAARTALDELLIRCGGYSSDLTITSPQDAPRSLQASLRIPAGQLEVTLKELKSLGNVETETQKGEEVTGTHTDLLARLRNSRETEQRLQAILIQRTGKVSDVLEVEQEIARVRGEIERMEGEQQSLEHRVKFSTVELQLSGEYKAQLAPSSISVPRQLRNSIVSGFTTAFESIVGLLLFLCNSGPVIILWTIILALPLRLIWKRHKRLDQTSGITP